MFAQLALLLAILMALVPPGLAALGSGLLSLVGIDGWSPWALLSWPWIVVSPPITAVMTFILVGVGGLIAEKLDSRGYSWIGK